VNISSIEATGKLATLLVNERGSFSFNDFTNAVGCLFSCYSNVRLLELRNVDRLSLANVPVVVLTTDGEPVLVHGDVAFKKPGVETCGAALGNALNIYNFHAFVRI
jgi:hypothetical protein